MRKDLSIKDYYFKHYKYEKYPPNKIKEDTTFAGLLETIESKKSVDTYLFVAEPIALFRSRVLAMLCEQYGLEWEYLLNMLKQCK